MLASRVPPAAGRERRPRLEVIRVVPEALRCMQCGICSYTCPVGIDVRAYAWDGRPVDDSRCLTCGLCVASCPRSALELEPVHATLRTRA